MSRSTCVTLSSNAAPERYLRVDGRPPPPTWDAIAGIYKTRDQRFVRVTHTNFRHHRDAVCTV